MCVFGCLRGRLETVSEAVVRVRSAVASAQLAAGGVCEHGPRAES